MGKLAQIRHDNKCLQLEERLLDYGYTTLRFLEYEWEGGNGELDVVGIDHDRNSVTIIEYKGSHSQSRQSKAKEQLRRGKDYFRSLGVDNVYGVYIAGNKVKEMYKWRNEENVKWK